MSTLPPEILTTIFEFACPPPTFPTFPERSANLRAFALVCKTWSSAQHLLFDYPVIYPTEKRKSTAFKLRKLLDQQKGRAVTRHLRLLGTGQQPIELSKSVGTRLASSLTSLTLVHVKVNPNIFLAVPSLRELSLDSSVTFEPKSPSKACTLLHLTDLSTRTFSLPSFLLPTQLPALERVARCIIFASGRTEADQPFTFEKLLQLGDQLDFVSCDVCEIYHRSGEPDVVILGNKMLLDIDDILRVYTLRKLSNTGILSSFKHVRVKERKLGRRVNQFSDDECDMELLNAVVESWLPNLETLVVPCHWRNSPIYEDFKSFVKERNLILLHEEDNYAKKYLDGSYALGWNYRMGESMISGAFREHRRKMREISAAS